MRCNQVRSNGRISQQSQSTTTHHSYHMKKLLLILAIIVTSIAPASATLHEADIESTLHSLRYDVQCRWDGLKVQIEHDNERVKELRKIAKAYDQSSRINQIMLFSTDRLAVQDLAYACKVCIDEYEKFKTEIVDSYASNKKHTHEWMRQDDSLRIVLNSIKQMKLKPQSVAEIKGIDSLLNLLDGYNVNHLKRMKALEPLFHKSWERIQESNKYATALYDEVRVEVVINSDNNIINILRDIKFYLKRIAYYSQLRYGLKFQGHGNYTSLWNLDGILATSSFFLHIFLVSAAIGLVLMLILKYIYRRKGQSVNIWSNFLMPTTVINALVWAYLEITNTNDLLAFSTHLFCGYSVVLAIITLALWLRLRGHRFVNILRCYLPILVISLSIMLCRAMVVPDDIINVFFCPFILLFVIWICIVGKTRASELQPADRNLLYVTIGVFIVAFFLGAFGYQFIGCMLIIFWFIQLEFIFGVMCLRHWVNRFAKWRNIDPANITQTWYVVFLQSVFLPSLWIWSVLYSLVMSAGLYALDDMMLHYCTMELAPSSDLHFNIILLLVIICMALVCNYIAKSIPKLLLYYYSNKGDGNYIGRINIFRNLFNFLIWSGFVVVTFLLFNISTSWIGYTVTGLAAGLGLASKGLLEDVFYGVLLLSGRIKVGDWIICEGVRGQIKSVSFLDTVLISVDGTVITMKNSQLFEKHYENLTLNHGWEMLHVKFSVEFDQDINNIRNILLEEFKELDCYDRTRPVTLHCYQIGESGLMLDFRPWILAADHIAVNARVTEFVYNTLKKHGISCAFTQYDVRLHNIEEKK